MGNQQHRAYGFDYGTVFNDCMEAGVFVTLKVQSNPYLRKKRNTAKAGVFTVAFGAQDVYLTGSPQITYFKVVFKRHTNFAIESIAQTFSGTVRYGSKVTAVISRNGDLLGDMWLEATMQRGSSGTTFYPAEQLVKSITVELGGQQLDKLTNTWYRIYDNLYRNNNTDRAAYRAMTDFVDGEAADTTKRFFVPVLFWFCRSPGNYLPLIALQYHELRVTFEFDSETNIPGIKSGSTLDATLFADYVYLDQEERKKFASQPHEYLIEQVQFTGDENVTIGATSKAQQIRLSFNHPTKLLAWVVTDPTKHGKFTAGYAGATQEALAPLQNAKLMLNGHDRADVRVGAVYNKIVPYQANKANPDAGLYFMSFALSPTQHAPSGSLNLSRIDSAVLALTFKAASAAANAAVASNISNITTPETVTHTDAQNLSALRVFAINYNVLRVMSGIRSKSTSCSEQRAAGMALRMPYWGNSVNASGNLSISVYNSLVNSYKQLATSSIAGNSLELFLRSLLRNQKCQSRVMTSPTVTTKEIGRSAGTLLRALQTSIRRRLRDYQAMGPRELVIPDEGLRYSPAPCESMGIQTGEVSL